MGRILYVVVSNGGITGGQKMAIRHVETLRELGYDAYCYFTREAPSRVEHVAPLVQGKVYPDDIIVTPDDAPILLRQCAARRWRTILFCQNHYHRTEDGLAAIDALAALGRLHFLTVTERLGASLSRLYPGSTMDVVRAFADERRFRPAAEKRRDIVYAPWKRPKEAAAIAALFKRLHVDHADVPWRRVEGATERETAALFGGSSVFLSLSRMESLGITPLEAMAAGCICAGFTGIGGEAFATTENGFWVRDDDLEAAADALAQACAIVKEGGRALERRREAGYETARLWSHTAMTRQLAEMWVRVAPEVRIPTPNQA